MDQPPPAHRPVPIGRHARLPDAAVGKPLPSLADRDVLGLPGGGNRAVAILVVYLGEETRAGPLPRLGRDDGRGDPTLTETPSS